MGLRVLLSAYLITIAASVLSTIADICEHTSITHVKLAKDVQIEHFESFSSILSDRYTLPKQCSAKLNMYIGLSFLSNVHWTVSLFSRSADPGRLNGLHIIASLSNKNDQHTKEELHQMTLSCVQAIFGVIPPDLIPVPLYTGVQPEDQEKIQNSISSLGVITDSYIKEGSIVYHFPEKDLYRLLRSYTTWGMLLQSVFEASELLSSDVKSLTIKCTAGGPCYSRAFAISSPRAGGFSNLCKPSFKVLINQNGWGAVLRSARNFVANKNLTNMDTLTWNTVIGALHGRGRIGEFSITGTGMHRVIEASIRFEVPQRTSKCSRCGVLAAVPLPSGAYHDPDEAILRKHLNSIPSPHKVNIESPKENSPHALSLWYADVQQSEESLRPANVSFSVPIHLRYSPPHHGENVLGMEGVFISPPELWHNCTCCEQSEEGASMDNATTQVEEGPSSYLSPFFFSSKSTKSNICHWGAVHISDWTITQPVVNEPHLKAPPSRYVFKEGCAAYQSWKKKNPTKSDELYFPAGECVETRGISLLMPIGDASHLIWILPLILIINVCVLAFIFVIVFLRVLPIHEYVKKKN